MNIHRLSDRSTLRMDALAEAGQRQGHPVQLPDDAWTVDKIHGPNITDKQTVISFAKMASNAYVTGPLVPGWEDIGMGFNYTEHFGWEDDGLRGHVFADRKNSTVVVAIKGTSVALFDGSGPERRDRENDNLFFSCCCGQGGLYTWRQVCDCQTSTYTCNSTCVVSALKRKNHYYYAGLNIFRNVSKEYPNAQVWMTGHSLGGSVASLVALTHGVPSVSFEAPGDAMPAARLGLPIPPGYHAGDADGGVSQGTAHFGHTADPIFMGSANGPGFVSWWGFAMESVCHTGLECVYDTVADLGWRQNLNEHRIVKVLHDVIEIYDDVPKCVTTPDCVDCYNWKYFRSNGTDTKKSSTSSYTRTRTETCKTPGWWGCLDRSTATTSSTSSPTKATYTVTSTTCLTPGNFFGCKEASTTTYTSISRASKTHTPTITTTSMRPGSRTSTRRVTSTSSQSGSTTCGRGLFGGCEPSPDESPWTAATSIASPGFSMVREQLDL